MFGFQWWVCELLSLNIFAASVDTVAQDWSQLAINSPIQIGMRAHAASYCGCKCIVLCIASTKWLTAFLCSL